MPLRSLSARIPSSHRRVARYTPSLEPDIRTKIEHRFISINFEHLLIEINMFATSVAKS